MEMLQPRKRMASMEVQELQEHSPSRSSTPTRPDPARIQSADARSYHALLDIEDSSEPAEASRSAKPNANYLQQACKTFHLDLIYSVIAKARGRQLAEEEKVAFNKDRRHAAIHCLIHVLPVLTAVVLLFFNIWQYYIGGELAGVSGQDAEKLAALQFAAKLHELLMLASLGTVVFSKIREELAFGDGVPFGAVFVGQEIDSISTLWSVGFWAVIYDAWEQRKGGRRKKWALVLLITTCILLGVSVGPSSANLMRPRLDNWPAGGTSYWINATSSALYPTYIDANSTPTSCSQNTGDPACPYGDVETLIQSHFAFWPWLQAMGAMPQSLYVSSPYSLRLMGFSHRSVYNDSREIWTNGFTAATAPMSAISDGLSEASILWAYAAANVERGKRFRYRNDVTYTVNANQPVVLARCALQQASTVSDNSQLNASFVDLGSAIDISNGAPNPDGRWNGVEWVNFSEYTEWSQSSTWLEDALYNQSAPSLLWVDDESLLNATSSTISAIAAFPESILGQPVFFSCSVASWMVPITLTATRNSPKTVSGGPIGDLPLDSNWTLVYPSAAWADYTNPSMSQSNDSAFSLAVKAAGLWNSSNPCAEYNSEFVVENILTTLLVNGIARMSYNTTMAGTLRGPTDAGDPWAGGAWATELLPHLRLGQGGDAYQLSPAAMATASKFVMQAAVNGYAYSHYGAAQKAFMGCLMMYGLLAVWHTYRTLKTGYTSNAWKKSPEIVGLALNSERPAAMHNTGAGINTIRTFETKVHVHAKGERLEMTFKDTQEGGEPVRPARTYQ